MRRCSLGFFAFALFFAGTSLAGVRYDELRNPQRIAIAPLRGGGSAVAVNATVGNLAGANEVNAIMTIDERGVVKAARKLGGFIVTFLTTSPGGDLFAGFGTRMPIPVKEQYLRVAKLRPDLSVVWTRHIVSVDGSTIGFRRGIGTRDGGLLLAGTRDSSQTVIAKLNARGDVAWATRVDPSGEERIAWLSETRDGGYLAVGTTERAAWLIRLDANGAVRWQHGWATSAILRAAVEMDDGGILVAGQYKGHPLLLKTNREGAVVWSRTMSLSVQVESLSRAGGRTIAAVRENQTVIHLLSIRQDGSPEWQRLLRLPPDFIAMTYEFEDAMVAADGDRVTLAVVGNRRPHLYQLDARTGSSTCGWITAETSAKTDVVLSAKDVAVEMSKPGLVSRNATVTFAALEVHAKDETCPAQIQVAAAPAPARPVRAFRSVPDDSAQRKHYAELLLSKKFDELTAIGDALRRDRPSRDPMRPELAVMNFYAVFANDETGPEKTRLALLREWVATRPSLTARIALAHVLYDAAWDARGGGFSDSITATGGAAYDTFLAEAKRTLDAAGKAGQADPQYWNLRISLAHELGIEDARKVGLRALELHPDGEIAARVARYLYPQWGGDPETYMKFADDAARVTSRKYGDGMYTWLVYQIKNYDSSDDFKQYKADWNRVKKGADDVIRLSPEWLPSYHRYAKLAHLYKDRETARKLFQRPELDWYEDAYRMWGAREVYDIDREWALSSR